LPIRAKKRKKEQSMTWMCVEKYKRKSKGHMMTHIKKNMNPKSEREREKSVVFLSWILYKKENFIWLFLVVFNTLFVY
jgi:hypothetical protein